MESAAINTVFLFGLNHTTAPLAIREKYSLSGDGPRLALKEFTKLAAGQPVETVILSTCNRLEFYLAAANCKSASAIIDRFWPVFYGGAVDSTAGYFYRHQDDGSIDHLMRVASGLDSIALGETQILGQVADAYAKARAAQSAGPLLSRLFQSAVHCGKRARTETDISLGGTSISHAAVALAAERIPDLGQCTALIIGAGKMAQLAAGTLQKRGIRRIIILSRTLGNAQNLAVQVGGIAYNWAQLPSALKEAELVISATDAPHAVVHESNIIHTIPDRHRRRLTIIDIAMPRDVDENVSNLPGVELFDIDDLQSIVDGNLTNRRAAVPKVEQICRQEADAFREWLNTREITPTISSLRHKVEAIAAREAERTLQKLPDASPEYREEIEYLAHRIARKVLHAPTSHLRSQAASANGETAAGLIRALFDLDEK